MSETKESVSILWPNIKIQQAIWLQQVATEVPNETTIKDKHTHTHTFIYILR